MERCTWVGNDPIYIDYHDKEWGVPVYGSTDLFAKLILDGFQAGLSWITILRKRDNFYSAFDQFNPEMIASYNEKKIIELLNNKGIIRNKLKIRSTITNAQAFLDYESKGLSFSDFLWSFTGGSPVLNHWVKTDDIPTRSNASDNMSLALKKLGFKFTGTTICYAFMEAVGMINDHLTGCFRYKEIKKIYK